MKNQADISGFVSSKLLITYEIGYLPSPQYFIRGMAKLNSATPNKLYLQLYFSVFPRIMTF